MNESQVAALSDAIRLSRAGIRGDMRSFSDDLRDCIRSETRVIWYWFWTFTFLVSLLFALVLWSIVTGVSGDDVQHYQRPVPVATASADTPPLD